MDFAFTPKVQALQRRVDDFMQQHVFPNEQRFYDEVEENTRRGARWTPTRIVEELKVKAKAEGLWNLFLPDSDCGAGLKNIEYAPLAELMGRVPWASEVFNCNAPDTGNMETIERYGTPAQKRQWLEPLLAGDIRSAFAMTEPAVASSDATNILTSIVRDGDHYVINGRKWWTSGAGDPRCKVYIVMGKTDPEAPKHSQQSMILVPADTPGVTVLRPLNVFGYDDAPHGHMEVLLENVRVPAANMLLGEGRGFEIAQGRLGPGRIHHCMRIIGQAERALELMCKRLQSRVAFGKPVSEQTVWHERIAESRCMIEQARLLTLKAARPAALWVSPARKAVPGTMLPAVAARHWSRELAGMAYASVAVAVLSAICGLLLSYHLDLPSGPAIVLTAGGFWAASVVAGPVDGLIARWWRRPHLAG